MYVTSERIIVNKGRGQLSLRAHFLIALFVALSVPVVPVVPSIVALAILLAIAGIIALLLVRGKRLRRKWPTIDNVERGSRQFEVKRGQVLSIELGRPGRLRSGYLMITSLSSEPFNLKILKGKAFKVARNLMVRFDAARVKMVDSQSGNTR